MFFIDKKRFFDYNDQGKGGISLSTTYHIDHNHINEPLRFDRLSLIQIGTIRCREDASLSKHLHRNWFELTIVTHGNATVVTNGVPVKLSEGDIYLSFPAEFHEIIPEGNTPLHFDFFSFSTDHAPFLEDLESIMQNFAAAQERLLHSEMIRALVREVLSQLQLPESIPYRYEMLSAQLLQIYISLVRHFKDITPAADLFNASHTRQFCFSIMHYIDTHLYTMNSTGELAKLTNYNYSYLSHLFHSVTSQTLSGYFQKKRLEAASALLKENDLQISEIASLLHYSSVYAFSKAFRTHFGISPRAYRDQFR